MIGSHNSGSLSLLVACELISCYARGSKEEAHIVMVYTDLLGNSLCIAGNMRERYFFVLVVSGKLICMPKDTGPEAVTPACNILHSAVNVTFTEFHRKYAVKISYTLVYLLKTNLKCSLKLLTGHAEVGIFSGIFNFGNVRKHNISP